MRTIKIIRINHLETVNPQKIVIQGIWGGQLNAEFPENATAKNLSSNQNTERIMAYLPPFIKNLVLESDGFLFNSDAEKPFQAYILNRDNTIMDIISPKRIGECNLWQCKIPPNIFNNMHKLIINKGGKSS